MQGFASRPFPSRQARRLAAAVLLAALVMPGVARADCNEDFGKLMSKRMGEINALNANSKKNGGKLDPAAACPQLRSLAETEGVIVSYIQKNKDWCAIPDDLLDKMSASRVKTAGVATKACTFAVKLKQMQQQQATQQAQQAAAQQQTVKLPTGPL